MTEAEAQTHLAHAKQMVDEMVERTLDNCHDRMIRMGASEQVIDEQMQDLYRQVDAIRTATSIKMAEIAAKRVENGNAELH